MLDGLRDSLLEAVSDISTIQNIFNETEQVPETIERVSETDEDRYKRSPVFDRPFVMRGNVRRENQERREKNIRPLKRHGVSYERAGTRARHRRFGTAGRRSDDR
jgi:hypothetical protein